MNSRKSACLMYLSRKTCSFLFSVSYLLRVTFYITSTCCRSEVAKSVKVRVKKVTLKNVKKYIITRISCFEVHVHCIKNILF